MSNNKIFNYKIIPEDTELARIYNYPPYMISRYRMIFSSEELVSFLESVERGLYRSIRCNTLKLSDCGELVERLESRGFMLKNIPFLKHGYRVIKEPVSIGALEEYLMGYYYIQGAGSMLASEILMPRENQVIGDLAAAPGGKTTHLAQLMNNTGCIVAVEKKRERARKLRSNLRRLGVNNTVILVNNILELTWLNNFFDKILLDAPCTGEGLLVFKKERKASKTIEDLRRMSRLQVMLLEKSVKMLKPGDELLYATCSIAPEENEYVITSILNHHDDIEVLSTRHGEIGSPGLLSYNEVVFNSEMNKCLRLYPHRDGVEGFFYCLLRKKT